MSDSPQSFTFINWSNYRPKDSKKTPKWYRMAVQWYLSESLENLTPEEKYVFSALVARSNERNKPTLTVNYKFYSRLFDVGQDVIKSTLQKLEESSVISIVTRSNSEFTRSFVGVYSELEKEREKEKEKYICENDKNGQQIQAKGNGTGLDGILPPLLADPSPPDSAPPPLSLPKLAELWNEHAHALLPRVRPMNSASPRARRCRERFKEMPDEKYWIEVIQKMNESKFCLGKVNSWKANIEFLIRPDTHLKILEGQYSDASGSVSYKITDLTKHGAST